jgi:hypothetical protein
MNKGKAKVATPEEKQELLLLRKSKSCCSSWHEDWLRGHVFPLRLDRLLETQIQDCILVSLKKRHDDATSGVYVNEINTSIANENHTQVWDTRWGSHFVSSSQSLTSNRRLMHVYLRLANEAKVAALAVDTCHIVFIFWLCINFWMTIMFLVLSKNIVSISYLVE